MVVTAGITIITTMIKKRFFILLNAIILLHCWPQFKECCHVGRKKEEKTERKKKKKTEEMKGFLFFTQKLIDQITGCFFCRIENDSAWTFFFVPSWFGRLGFSLSHTHTQHGAHLPFNHLRSKLKKEGKSRATESVDGTGGGRRISFDPTDSMYGRANVCVRCVAWACSSFFLGWLWKLSKNSCLSRLDRLTSWHEWYITAGDLISGEISFHSRHFLYLYSKSTWALFL